MQLEFILVYHIKDVLNIFLVFNCITFQHARNPTYMIHLIKYPVEIFI